ncbi:hypothetical protein FHS57_004743 [Runella defluvii]|uniref:Uncharacterized protein n=1 Tax=Runella defluvii TaxID=370973 RepID=A0A7W5ZNP9_9BACT|nr:hypothetical protein [Runella defluvii]MBB3840723.1 hypothetical protein [Runella defluvii]
MKILPVLIVLLLSQFGFSQRLITFTYDANGNRISKQIKGSSPHPTVTASPEAVAPSQPSTLLATGCMGGSIQWQPVNQNGSQIVVNPTATTQYTAQCVVPGCATNGFARTTVSIIQCPAVQLSVKTLDSSPSVRYGQSVTLFAFGCTDGTVNWSSGNIGTPTNVPVYGSSTVFTATCQSTYCPNLGTASILIGGISGCLTGDVIISKQVGDWNDPNTWMCGRVPTVNDEVFINHQVNVNSIGYAKLIIKGAGYLVYDNSGTIILP